MFTCVCTNTQISSFSAHEIQSGHRNRVRIGVSEVDSLLKPGLFEPKSLYSSWIEAYPGNFSGFVVLFATAETAGRNYFKEVWQSMRFLSLIPRRFYYTTFANGVPRSCFFPRFQLFKCRFRPFSSTLRPLVAQ